MSDRSTCSTIAAAVFAALVSACSSAPAPVETASTPRAVEPTPPPSAPAAEQSTAATTATSGDGPFLYEVTIDGNTGWLFAAAWVDASEIPAVVHQYVEQAQRYMFEYDVFASMANDLSAEVPSLRRTLGEQYWNELRRWTPDVSDVHIDSMAPGIAEKEMLAPQTHGGVPMMASLLMTAQAGTGPLDFLVTNLEAYSDDWEASDLEALRHTLDNVRAAVAADLAYYDAYRAGDADALAVTFASRAPTVHRRFLHYNSLFAAGIYDAMRQPGTLTVVSVGHVVGDGGIVEQLREYGATVERIGQDSPATVPFPSANLSRDDCETLARHMLRITLGAQGQSADEVDSLLATEYMQLQVDRFVPTCRMSPRRHVACVRAASTLDEFDACVMAVN